MKTIFFTLSSTASYRNLLFFPGSVYDRLWQVATTRQDLRFVFLVPPKDFQKYQQIFAGKLNERCLLEPISVSYPKTFLEKAFYFFYSYFIYTGTTWQLATLGVRPDEPPAGGIFKKYLTPVKFLISRTFGRSRIMRERFVPFWYKKIFRLRPFFDLFERYQPDLVFLSHLYGRMDTELLAEARRRGVKTMGMASNWDHFDKYYMPHKVQTLLVQSEQMRDFAIRFQGYDPAKLVLVGYPYFDFMVDAQYVWPREKLLQSAGFPMGSKYILYVSGSAYCPDEPDIIEKILQWADDKKIGEDMRLLIRPYTGGRAKDKEFDEEKYNRFETHPRVAFYRKEFWGDMERSIHFMNLMRHADLVIAIYSTAMIEAAALDRPLVGIAFDGYKTRPLQQSIRRFAAREHFQDVWRSGAVRMVESFDALKSAIIDYFNNPQLDAPRRAALRARVCGPTDGKVSERIVEQILHAL